MRTRSACAHFCNSLPDRLQFLAYCIKKGEESGLFKRPNPTGPRTILSKEQIKAISDGEVMNKASSFMAEEKMAYEFAIQLAVNVEKGAKIAAMIAGGGDPAVTDLPGFPDVAAEIMEIKAQIGTVEECKGLPNASPADAMRIFIALVMAARSKR